MDAFEEALQKFNGTIYGSEMRDALYRCFDLIRVEINYHGAKIYDIIDKIIGLEGA